VHVRRRLVGNGVAPACAHLGGGGRGGEVELGNGAAEVARGGLDGGEGAELDVEALDGVADLGRPLAHGRCHTPRYWLGLRLLRRLVPAAVNASSSSSKSPKAALKSSSSELLTRRAGSLGVISATAHLDRSLQ
jgi:hypothetical protein